MVGFQFYMIINMCIHRAIVPGHRQPSAAAACGSVSVSAPVPTALPSGMPPRISAAFPSAAGSEQNRSCFHFEVSKLFRWHKILILCIGAN